MRAGPLNWIVSKQGCPLTAGPRFDDERMPEPGAENFEVRFIYR
jgi:hypothetical protein